MFDQWPDLTKEEHEILASTLKVIEGLALTQAANFGPLKLWMDAEAARALDKTQEALALYDEAIAAALAVDYIHIAACMNERCAKMLLNPKLAAGYLIEARDLWRRWGCEPKVTAMALAHPELFPSASVPLPHGMDPSAFSSTGPMTNGGQQSHHSGHATLEELPEHPLVHFDDGDRPSSMRDEATSSSATWTHDRPPKPRRTPSSGSLPSHSHSTGEGHELQSDNRGSIAGQPEPVPRSQLATELDLRTVVSASSVISMEISVDG